MRVEELGGCDLASAERAALNQPTNASIATVASTERTAPIRSSANEQVAPSIPAIINCGEVCRGRLSASIFAHDTLSTCSLELVAQTPRLFYCSERTNSTNVLPLPPNTPPPPPRHSAIPTP